MPAETLELAGVLEEIHQLHDVFLGLINTSHITEAGLDLLLAHQASLALAEGHGAFATTTSALHLAHEEDEDGDNDQDRKGRDQQLRPDALAGGLFPGNLHIIVVEVIHQVRVLDRRPRGREVAATLALTGNRLPLDGHFLDLTAAYHLDELGVVDLVLLRLGVEVLEHHQQHRRDDQPQDQIFSPYRSRLLTPSVCPPCSGDIHQTIHQSPGGDQRTGLSVQMALRPRKPLQT